MKGTCRAILAVDSKWGVKTVKSIFAVFGDDIIITFLTLIIDRLRAVFFKPFTWENLKRGSNLVRSFHVFYCFRKTIRRMGIFLSGSDNTIVTKLSLFWPRAYFRTNMKVFCTKIVKHLFKVMLVKKCLMGIYFTAGRLMYSF